MIPKSGCRVRAFAKLASAGEAGSETIVRTKNAGAIGAARPGAGAPAVTSLCLAARLQWPHLIS
jgi:hypothetical protein